MTDPGYRNAVEKLKSGEELVWRDDPVIVAEALNEALNAVRAERNRLREALSFYADPVRWCADGAIQTPGAHPLLESAAAHDSGLRAREALEAGER